MYVVTFYSFKGGVGRTLALANVACELVRRGRRVLVVDFDLEAPGLPTLPVFAPGLGKPGVVEFVEEYRRTRVSPDVHGYLSQCDVDSTTGALWFMSAGNGDALYAARLASIDWRRLYEEEDGFLLFEDLKAQWRQAIQPDYVLIDSRTGHTDVAGLCTRHLADAVVALFLPNAQNIVGLSRIVDEIRSEPKKKTALYFVASNVPSLDDENEILRRQMEEARKALRFDSVSTIHHYDALTLLEQSIFVVDRPSTRLAREYVAIADVVVRGNLSDRDGALGFLRELTRPEIAAAAGNLDRQFEEIVSSHSDDGEVLSQLATAHAAQGDYASSASFFSAAIAGGYNSPSVRIERAGVYRVLGETARSIEDYRHVAESRDSDEGSFLRALLGLAELEPLWLREFTPGRIVTSGLARRVAQVLMGKRETLPIAERFLRLAPKEDHAKGRELVLCLIGQRRFEEALALVGPEGDIADEFNAAVCLWGMTGVPPVDRFTRVVVLHESRSRGGANYYQCLALSATVLGDQALAARFLAEARRWILLMPKRTFSAWRFLEVDFDEFVHDLAELGSSDELNCVPPFLGEESPQEELFRPRRD